MFRESRLAEYRKGFAAAVGGVAELVSLGMLHGTALAVAQVIIAGATAAGVVIVPNKAPEARGGQ